MNFRYKDYQINHRFFESFTTAPERYRPDFFNNLLINTVGVMNKEMDIEITKDMNVNVHVNGDKEENLDSFRLYNHLRDDTTQYFLPPDLFSKIQTALDIIEQGIRLYGPSRIFASYNGGKDAVVIMHLFRAALANFVHKKEEEAQQRNNDNRMNEDKEEKSKNKGEGEEKDSSESIESIGREEEESEENKIRPRLIYFYQKNEFPEVEELVFTTTELYDLDLKVYKNKTFVEGLSSLIEEVSIGFCHSALANLQ